MNRVGRCVVVLISPFREDSVRLAFYPFLIIYDSRKSRKTLETR